jgi:hypothetical protein
MKLIICDKNKKLIEKIKNANIKSNTNKFDIVVMEDDVFEAKEKYPDAKICTASNPEFSAWGGVDLALNQKYPNEWNNLREFVWTDNLFPIITVNSELKAEEWRVQRSLIGVFAYLHKFNFILMGIGTGIGGFSEDILVEYLVKIFSYSDLSYSNLSHSNLRGSNLSYSNLRGSNLSYSNLSNVKNMIDDTKNFMKNFKFNKKGLIVYKGIGHTSYPINPKWKIQEGEYLTEIVNPCKNCECGCGVNFGTIEYIKRNYPLSEIWECLIEFEDLVDVVVPYNTDGKARCSRLKLIRKLKQEPEE